MTSHFPLSKDLVLLNLGQKCLMGKQMTVSHMNATVANVTAFTERSLRWGKEALWFLILKGAGFVQHCPEKCSSSRDAGGGGGISRHPRAGENNELIGDFNNIEPVNLRHIKDSLKAMANSFAWPMETKRWSLANMSFNTETARG